MKTVRLAVPVALLVLATLAGCGSDDAEPASALTDDEQTAADNLAAQIIRSGSMRASGSGISDAQATCVAEGAVADVGLAELQGYGIVTEDLLVDKSIQGVQMKAADAEALAGVFVDCVDAEALFEDRFLTGLPAGADEECVRAAVGVDGVRDVLAASFQGSGTSAYQQMQRDVTACGAGKRAPQ